MASNRQKGHGKKRPRSFHRGRAQGHIDDKLLRSTVEPAFAAADADRAEVVRVSERHRSSMRDWEDAVVQCSRVSGSCALAPLPATLLA